MEEDNSLSEASQTQCNKGILVLSLLRSLTSTKRTFKSWKKQRTRGPSESPFLFKWMEKVVQAIWETRYLINHPVVFSIFQIEWRRMLKPFEKIVQPGNHQLSSLFLCISGGSYSSHRVARGSSCIPLHFLSPYCI